MGVKMNNKLIDDVVRSCRESSNSLRELNFTYRGF